MSIATPASPLRLYLPRLHPVQHQVRTEAARFNVLDAGRRFGKNILGVDLVVRTTLAGQPAAWMAPTYKLLADAWRELKGALGPVIADKSEQEHRLQLRTGGVLECWSLDDQDPARGRKYKRVLVDEAAMVRSLVPLWQEAVRPTLTDLLGDAWFLSTPKGLNGFWQLYQLGEDPEQHEWRSWKFPTACNPHLDPDEIEAARSGLPERVFAQEYLAEFLADGAGVFRGIERASVLSPQPEPEPGHAYVGGFDPAKLSDFSVVTILDACCKKQVWIDRSNQVDYVLQLKRVAGLAKRYHLRTLVVERTGVGEPLLEQLGRAGVPTQAFVTTNATKAALVEDLALALEQEGLKLLNDPAQIGELLAFDATRLASGLLRYSAPEGMHDDTVMALGLAYQAAKVGPRRPATQYGWRH